MYSPTWLEPVDTVTGRRPLAPVQVELDILVGQRWVPTDIKPTMTSSGAVAYPGLGRSSTPLTATAQRYRARFGAAGYLPLYRADRDGEEFEASPYNDTNQPAHEAVRTPVEFAPRVGYRFSAEVPVLYGEVATAAGTRVADALVESVLGSGAMSRPRTERTLTDRRGVFALPLRWARTDTDTVVVARFTRDGPPRTGVIAVRLPGDLATRHTIEIA
jgi:hypothetical protein